MEHASPTTLWVEIKVQVQVKLEMETTDLQKKLHLLNYVYCITEGQL